MDDRVERIGRNEALFRTVNERVKAVNEAFSLVLERTDFVCECGRGDCTEPIAMTLEEYEAVRSEATQFAVVPGHELEDAEAVVQRNDRFAVVRKNSGDAAEIAEATDPRA